MVLGLRGTGDFVANEVPESWDKSIHYLFPNGVGFAAFISQIPSETVGYWIHHWWARSLETSRIFVNNAAGYLAGDTMLLVDDGSGTGQAKTVNKGTILLVERTGEFMIVTSDPVTTTTIVVQRNIDGLTAAALVDNDAITIFGNAYSHGSSSPEAITEGPTGYFNYAQNFKMSLEETRDALVTEVRTAASGNYDDLVKETLRRYLRAIEKSFLRQNRALLTGSNGQPMPITGGATYWIPAANKTTMTALSGSTLMGEASLETICEGTFQYGSDMRQVYAGGLAEKAFHRVARANWVPTMLTNEYGVRVTRYVNQFGTLDFVRHSEMRNHPLWRQDALFLDMEGMRKKRFTIKSTQFHTNAQAKDADLRKDYFHGEFGLQMVHGETDYLVTGITGGTS